MIGSFKVYIPYRGMLRVKINIDHNHEYTKINKIFFTIFYISSFIIFLRFHIINLCLILLKKLHLCSLP